MRKIDVSRVKDVVRGLCLKANFELAPDVLDAIKAGLKRETKPRAKSILRSLIENAAMAKKNKMAICQDTGVVSVYLDIGRNVILAGGNLEKAINLGVREAYKGGCLRKSVVGDPLTRKNTGTNTPAVIVTNIVEGSKVKITVSPKGFGSENKSRIKMFSPTASFSDIGKFIIEVVKEAGPSACPPLVLGIGIGGTFDSCAALSKKALLMPVGGGKKNRPLACLERELTNLINSIGMGPMGLGGKTTTLGVNIIAAPTHIAGLPVAVSVSCHATRSACKVI